MIRMEPLRHVFRHVSRRAASVGIALAMASGVAGVLSRPATALGRAAPADRADPAEPAARAGARPPITHRIMEAYPERLLASIERRNREVAAARELGRDGPGPESVIRRSIKWPQEQVVKVAFLDGDQQLHKAVADAAVGWSPFCNIKFDFGRNPETGEYRRWKTTDTTYKADIRISFDQEGYWSLLGTDSINPVIGNPGDPDGGRPNQRSMNFEGFKDALPADFRGTVLHEFGHALGFEHEHQHPDDGCEQDFRWFDDPGYRPRRDQFGQFIQDLQGRRPGIYTVLGGPPNNWSRRTVDFNLRQLTDSHAFEVGPFDRRSIMKYFFEDWMFHSGADSHCFTAGSNDVLSNGDKRAVARAYPPAQPPNIANDGSEDGGGFETTGGGGDAAQRIQRLEKQRVQALELLTNIATTSEDAKRHYESLKPSDDR